MHVFCVYFTAPPPQNVQPPAPSSSSHAPPPSSSSRYRERRARRTHRSGGTRDDRYRSGEQRSPAPKCSSSHFGCPTTVTPAVQRTTAQFSELKRSDNSPFLSLDPGLFQRDKLKSCGERVCESEADSSALPQLGSPLSEDPLLRQKSDVSGWLCMRRL